MDREYTREGDGTSELAGISGTESQLAVGDGLRVGGREGDSEQVAGNGTLAEEVVGDYTVMSAMILFNR